MQKILALVAAKQELFLEECDTPDGRDLMTPDNTKWIRISEEVMRAGFSTCVRDGPACKMKWNQIIPDYKRLIDYFSRTGRNVPDYWDLSTDEKRAESLPKQFPQEIFYAIHEWFRNRPQIHPPHVRDTLAPTDSNYQVQGSQVQHNEEDQSDPETEDPMDMGLAEPVEDIGDSTPPPSSHPASLTPSHLAYPSTSAGTHMLRPFQGVPTGLTPQVINPSDTSPFQLRRRPGNTAVKRKAQSGPAMLAEATKVMTKHIQDIAESSRDLEI